MSEECRPDSGATPEPTASDHTFRPRHDPVALAAWRRERLHQRRRASRALDALLRELHPPVDPPKSSTYGLTEPELRRHANKLVLDGGWSVPEVLEVLAVERAR